MLRRRRAISAEQLALVAMDSDGPGASSDHPTPNDVSPYRTETEIQKSQQPPRIFEQENEFRASPTARHSRRIAIVQEELDLPFPGLEENEAASTPVRADAPATNTRRRSSKAQTSRTDTATPRTSRRASRRTAARESQVSDNDTQDSQTAVRSSRSKARRARTSPLSPGMLGPITKRIRLEPNEYMELPRTPKLLDAKNNVLPLESEPVGLFRGCGPAPLVPESVQMGELSNNTGTVTTPLSSLASKLLRPIVSTFTRTTTAGTEGVSSGTPPRGVTEKPSSPTFGGGLFSAWQKQPKPKPFTTRTMVPEFPTGTVKTLIPPYFVELTDLISSDVGGRVIFATDDFFAPAINLLNPSLPVWKAAEFTEFGKWYDGWETRRRREPKHDWCLIELGIPGLIEGVEISTRFFTGNYAPLVSVEGASVPNLSQKIRDTLNKHGDPYLEHQRLGRGYSSNIVEAVEQILETEREQDPSQWRDIVGVTALCPGTDDSLAEHFFKAQTISAPGSPQRNPITHIRLNLFPDGGIARLRVYGIPKKLIGNTTIRFSRTGVDNSPEKPAERSIVNLASVLEGAVTLCCSNKHFGHPRNLLLSSIPRDMSSGWETARKPFRTPVLERFPLSGEIKNLVGRDWLILRLAARGALTQIEVDTAHFKGNFPESISIMGSDFSNSFMTTEELVESFRNEEARFEAENRPEEIDFLVEDLERTKFNWKTLVPRTPLRPDHNHIFTLATTPDGSPSEGHTVRKGSGEPLAVTLQDAGPVSFIRIAIYPDGGIARFRAYGKPIPL